MPFNESSPCALGHVSCALCHLQVPAHLANDPEVRKVVEDLNKECEKYRRLEREVEERKVQLMTSYSSQNMGGRSRGN